MKKRKIRVPAKDYQPTKADLEETARLDFNGLTFEQAAQRPAGQGTIRDG